MKALESNGNAQAETFVTVVKICASRASNFDGTSFYSVKEQLKAEAWIHC